MIIDIDATNIKTGGGLTHLKQIVENNRLEQDSIHLIGGTWLDRIKGSNNVSKLIFKKEFKNKLNQEYFKAFKLEQILKKGDISFIPGGTFSSKKINYVSMSQNMLVFEEKERNRFPRSLTWLRYLILERLQLKSFSNATGIIYISQYAKQYIENKYPHLKSKKSTVIYHGISDNFRQKPKKQKSIQEYSKQQPFKLLYISIINYYKHQWNVIEAVKILREKGYPIELELIGPINKSLRSKFDKCLKGTERYVNYRGKVPYEEISLSYKKANMFLFASTCENMPNILIEAMSAGLPILCSNYGPMPEVLKDAGAYMDPTQVDNISFNLERLLNETEIRQKIAQKAYNYSQDFSWEKTSKDTFDFIKRIAEERK
ncbi:MAG: glycosyl transferase [Flavobacteriaceae bacterium]|nr:glycosyl transferase [Flavobacteriaceae bacterium]|tara:strand:+ start:24 stop:1142 length:1119 start_codon:yes stop_codon:yes gene_type:complete